MNPEQAIAERFHCPKCRSRQCATHHVALPQGGLPIPFGRYVTATCALCGFTEFYDLAVVESAPAPIPPTIVATDEGA